MSELTLNTLRRFSKSSDQLLLEHYSHCEVPAGCGGVVLRWRDGALGAMGKLSLFCPRQVTAGIDGVPTPSARLLLPWGRHVLTARIDRLPRKGALVLSLVTEPRHRTPDNRSVPAESVLCSAADGTWRYTTTDPGPDWASPDLDDSGWSVMCPVPPPIGPDGTVPWLLRRLSESGARPIGVPGAPESLWIRRVFTLEAS